MARASDHDRKQPSSTSTLDRSSPRRYASAMHEPTYLRSKDRIVGTKRTGPASSSARQRTGPRRCFSAVAMRSYRPWYAPGCAPASRRTSAAEGSRTRMLADPATAPRRGTASALGMDEKLERDVRQGPSHLRGAGHPSACERLTSGSNERAHGDLSAPNVCVPLLFYMNKCDTHLSSQAGSAADDWSLNGGREHGSAAEGHR